jgi:hypothetical protein
VEECGFLSGSAEYPVQKQVYNGTCVFVQGDDPTSFFDKNFAGNVEVWLLNFVDV